MDKETIGVIVPVYNTGGVKLSRCIDSLVNQTYKNVCIILVDDGSKDESGRVCDEWKEKDSRIAVIHQKNQGSIAARRNGLYSEYIQETEHCTFCDSDDTMPSDAIERLAKEAFAHNADCVCGQIQSIKGKIKYVPSRECFQIEKPKYFDHEEIIDHIYLSCFGLIDYPVSYNAKLYRTSVLSAVFNFTPVVQFMGDDLNCSLHLIPTLNSLVLIPDVIYNYFYGGITSKFMPYAFDDFLALYDLKEEKAQIYFKDKAYEGAHHFMKNEMMWITLSRFTDCYVLGKYSVKQTKEEIRRVCEIPTVRLSAEYVASEKHALNAFANNILNHNYDAIWAFVKRESYKKKFRRFAKRILSLTK